MLSIHNLKVSYGNIVAVHNISLQVRNGQIVCLIGPNGAGKTTTLRAISGLLPISGGSITLNEIDLLKKQPHQIAKAGIIPVPEGRGIFPQLTVKENLEMGAYLEDSPKRKRNNLERVFTLFPELVERLNHWGGNLSGGQQQMLAIGRALMANPKILLMDEPSMGLAPIVVERIFQAISKIRDGTTILLVEQNANLALQYADYAYVLEHGEVVLQGSAQSLLDTEDLVSAYFGGIAT
ncbi:ABC transporter ATP-binding protein [Fodinisporobacter ferrooxydans]|uniref:ABC transporter ATP-binding protein n=1 Tax=Fodinisporobacter ferrooxydans TaxID=2901836 RepID=A0ABY4CET2_9BACL|nr:ABC transporter ATP-binding protein [Alicyclobacillaceae bacterium MYW30-H2]